MAGPVLREEEAGIIRPTDVGARPGSYDDPMRRTLPPWVADTVIAVGLLVTSLAVLGDYRDLGLSDVFVREPDAFGYVLLGLQTLPLAFRRRYPVPVLLVVLGAFAIDRGLDYPSSLTGVGTLIAVHAVGSELSPRRSAIWGWSVVGGVGIYTVIGSIVYDSVEVSDALFVFAAGAVALFLGREVHQRRERARLLEERAQRAEADREERARQAVAEERSRIARELHDVVAHQMMVMTLQAEGASRIAGGDDPRVAEALNTIRDSGRAGLAEMRRMVGLLRTDPTGDTELSPQPSLDRLDQLVGHFRSAGLPVDVEVVGEVRDLPDGVDLSAYRIVQESLTNALKHGGPEVSATVRLDYRDDVLDITVIDDGRGPIGDPGTGHGLVGMRERTALLGGDLRAGAHSGGGFEVRARLPVGA